MHVARAGGPDVDHGEIQTVVCENRAPVDQKVIGAGAFRTAPLCGQGGSIVRDTRDARGLLTKRRKQSLRQDEDQDERGDGEP
jgi:hypothetical protein